MRKHNLTNNSPILNKENEVLILFAIVKMVVVCHIFYRSPLL